MRGSIAASLQGEGALGRLGFFAAFDEAPGVVDEAEEDVVGGVGFFPGTL